MDRTQRHRLRLDMLAREAGGDEKLAARTKTATSYISQLRTARQGIARKFCDRLESAMGKPAGWMDQWLPEEFDENTVPESNLSSTETRILRMWRGWNPAVKQYVFGQMKIANYTKDVLPAMFLIGAEITEEDIDRIVVDNVAETGEFRKLSLPAMDDDVT
jgi:hypothetical protein